MPSLILGHPVIHLKSVDSTNNYATTLLQTESVAEGTVILADYQHHGKGQGINRWISEAQRNLLFSIILKPGFLLAEKQFYLSMCISNGIIDYLHSFSGTYKIKWPNDIFADGKKLAGILIENTILGNALNTSIVGIGINMNQSGFPADLSMATSLYITTGHQLKLDDEISSLLHKLAENLNQLYNGFFPQIRTNYLNNLYLLNEWHTYHDHSGEFEGRIIDVADSGELVVKHRKSEIKQYGFKEISF